MRRWMLWLSAACVLGLVAASVRAADEAELEDPSKPKQKKERVKRPVTVWGNLKSIDAEGGKIVVTVTKKGQEPVDVTFLVTADTKILIGKDKDQKALADLEAGCRAMVKHKKAEEEGGAATALEIHAYGVKKKTTKEGKEGDA